MTKGLDAQIDQRINAYRNNPQQLQQRYAQNKELVDLLALQKLKSEKDAVARDMQLKQQQQPSNIKQQLEREMFNRTKDDMVKQTSGILAKRQGDQQRNLRRLTKNNPPNMSGGITGLTGMPGVSKKPVTKMNQGGIVNFSRGGLTEADKNRLIAAGLGTPVSLFEQGTLSFKALQTLAENTGLRPLGSAPPMPPEPNLNIGRRKDILPPPIELTTPMINKFFEPGSKINETPAMPTLPKDNVAVPIMPEFPKQTSAADRGIMAALQGFNAANEKIGDAGIDMGAFDMGVAKANQVTGRADKAQRFKDMQDKYAAFETANFSPEQAQFERVAGQLAAAGGATSLGQMGKQMAFTGDKIRNRQKTKAFDRMVTAFNTDIAGMKMDAELGSAALRTGETILKEVGLNSRAAKAAARAGNAENLRVALKMIELGQAEQTADRAFELDQERLKISKRLANVEELGLTLRGNKLLLEGESIDLRREELAARIANMNQTAVISMYTSLTDISNQAKTNQMNAFLDGLDKNIDLVSERLSDAVLDTEKPEVAAALEKQLAELTAKRREFVGTITDGILNNKQFAGDLTLYDLKSMLEQNPFLSEMLTGAKAIGITKQ
jgi:predicted GIY-YIG superfamily endonuclease